LEQSRIDAKMDVHCYHTRRLRVYGTEAGSGRGLPEKETCTEEAHGTLKRIYPYPTMDTSFKKVLMIGL
jgi:hypothetical protein